VIKEETGESYTVKLPQVVPTKEAQYLEPAQIKKFLAAVHGSSVELPALLALHSLRRSELLAVTWEDIDLTRKVIHVRGAVVYGEDGKLVEKAANKNKTSRRTVPIMIPRLYELLEEQWQPSGPVVTQAPTTIFAAINRICKAEDLPLVGIHGLRHSFASLAAHIGMQEKTTMEIGGWANDATMKRIYTHALTVDRLTGSNKMADYFTATPAQ
jgi:integrase